MLRTGPGMRCFDSAQHDRGWRSPPKDKTVKKERPTKQRP